MKYDDINFNDYELKEEYPIVNNQNPKDPDTINKIINAYADSKGEITAVMQYIYQSFYVKPHEETKNLSYILERISIKEMMHFEILSQLLLSFDVNPKFCTYIDRNPNICNPWSTCVIKYITDIPEFLKYNIVLEESAIKAYQNIIDTTPVENVKQVISRIIKDEEEHIKVFNILLEISLNK